MLTVKLRKLVGSEVSVSAIRLYEYEKEDQSSSGGPMGKEVSTIGLKPSLRILPNFIRNKATVSFVLPADGLVRIVIYDVTGRRVAQLLNRTLSAGTHSIDWNLGKRPYTSLQGGVYFIRLHTDSFNLSEKVLILR